MSKTYRIAGLFIVIAASRAINIGIFNPNDASLLFGAIVCTGVWIIATS